MISTLVTRPAETSFSFPLLLESKTLPNFIVLFTDEDTGTVVCLPHGYDDTIDGAFTMGHHSADWDIDTFDFFDGEVNWCNEPELDTQADGEESTSAMGFDACTGCDAAACDAVALAGLLDRVVKASAKPAQDPPPAVEGNPRADSDCGHDNAFAAMLARLVPGSVLKP